MAVSESLVAKKTESPLDSAYNSALQGLGISVQGSGIKVWVSGV